MSVYDLVSGDVIDNDTRLVGVRLFLAKERILSGYTERIPNPPSEADIALRLGALDRDIGPDHTYRLFSWFDGGLQRVSPCADLDGVLRGGCRQGVWESIHLLIKDPVGKMHLRHRLERRSEEPLADYSESLLKNLEKGRVLR